MANRIQIRRDSENNWNDINPILADGELALNYNNNRIKIGDGGSYWNDLPYANSGFNPSSLATVASTGSFSDLVNNPIPTSYNSTNNGQFLSLNTNTGNYDLTAGFRITNAANVVYPGGIIDTDQIGDVAFSSNALYYCYQTPNAYTVAYSGSNGWTPPGWLRINSIGPGNKVPQVGDKLTDGTDVSTIVSIEAPWQIQYDDVRFMLINISPTRSSWKNGAGNLTVYTGDAPHLTAWAKLGVGIVDAPTHNNSPGIAGQIAYDTGYMYRCTQSTVTEISATYKTPKFTSSGYNNQGGLTDIRINNDGVVATPQVGWTVYDIDTSSSRVITNVSATTGQSGSIWILSYTGDLDFGSVTQVRLISQEAVDAVWKRVALSADTW